MSKREQDFISPSSQQAESPEIDSRYVKKRVGLDDELRLGPSPYLAMEELKPKNKNFREKLAQKGRPSPKDAVYGNFESKHQPHVIFKENGVISMGTGEKAGLGFQMDPEKGELTISGERLNLNFAEIDIRASIVQLIVNQLVDLFVKDGDLRARVMGHLDLQAKTAAVHATRWLRIESFDLTITTDVAQELNTDIVAAATDLLEGGGLSRGTLNIDSSLVVLTATKQFAINSDDILFGHENKFSPVSPMGDPFQPMRGVARQFDETTHFCPYVGMAIKGWITTGSEHATST